MKKGFTLAETLVVLAVIGILTAILLPVGINSAPDEDVARFQKGNSLLYHVINELVNSPLYYINGDLSIRPNGTYEGQVIYGGFKRLADEQLVETGEYIGTDADIEYFCNTFADIVSTKSVNCNRGMVWATNSHWTFVPAVKNPTADWLKTLDEAKLLFDERCTATSLDSTYRDYVLTPEIVTADDIVYYEVNPSATFGTIWYSGEGPHKLFGMQDEHGNYYMYKTFCMDIDGIDSGEAPFGYGIRIDGKILPGARATEWIKKSMQNKEFVEAN